MLEKSSLELVRIYSEIDTELRARLRIHPARQIVNRTDCVWFHGAVKGSSSAYIFYGVEDDRDDTWLFLRAPWTQGYFLSTLYSVSEDGLISLQVDAGPDHRPDFYVAIYDIKKRISSDVASARLRRLRDDKRFEVLLRDISVTPETMIPSDLRGVR